MIPAVTAAIGVVVAPAGSHGAVNRPHDPRHLTTDPMTPDR